MHEQSYEQYCEYCRKYDFITNYGNVSRPLVEKMIEATGLQAHTYFCDYATDIYENHSPDNFAIFVDDGFPWGITNMLYHEIMTRYRRQIEEKGVDPYDVITGEKYIGCEYDLWPDKCPCPDDREKVTSERIDALIKETLASEKTRKMLFEVYVDNYENCKMISVFDNKERQRIEDIIASAGIGADIFIVDYAVDEDGEYLPGKFTVFGCKNSKLGIFDVFANV